MQKKAFCCRIPMGYSSAAKFSDQPPSASHGTYRHITKILLGIRSPLRRSRNTGSQLIVNAMKLTSFLLTVAFLNVYASGSSQSITLSGKNIPLKTAFAAVKQQTEYVVFSNRGDLEDTRPISLSVSNMPLPAFLKLVLQHQPLDFIIENKTIVLTRKPAQSPAVLSSGQPNAGIVVAGVVSSTSGTLLPGVSIRIKGTSTGTVTDAQGAFSLNDVPENAVLQISSIGFEPLEAGIRITSNTPAAFTIDKRQSSLLEILPGATLSLRVTLRELDKELDAVVVVGYGTVKKRDLTGAVSSVKADDVIKTSAIGIDHALQGKIAGVSIIRNSAQPGGGIDVLVRGATSVNASNMPLYIVDGIPIGQVTQPDNNDGRTSDGTQSPLNFLNPNDIESIEVLKDASATAIYGSRAANGVILITTKRGVAGKPVVSYSFSYGIQKKTDTYKVMDLKTWMTSKNEIYLRDWSIKNGVAPYGTRTFSEAQLSPVNGIRFQQFYTDKQIAEAGPGTDWVGLITRDGAIKEHNVSVQGGTEKTKYLVSANYFNQQGILKNNGIKRYSGKVSMEQELSKYFRLNSNLIISRLDNDNVMFGDGAWGDHGALVNAAIMDPSIPVFDKAGNYSINPLLPNVPNPVSMLTITDKGVSDRFVGSADIISTPLAGLSLRLSLSMDKSNRTRSTYHPRTYLFGARSEGMGSINSISDEFKRAEFVAHYTKDLLHGQHMDFLYGSSYELFQGNNHFLKNTNFLTDAFLWYRLDAGSGSKVVASGGYKNNRLSHFGRVNYNLADGRYLFTATFRADAASQFARNHKWGFFPSLAAGWNALDESFMHFARPLFSQLKLRVSVGQTGNASIGDNAFAAYAPELAWNDEKGRDLYGVRQIRLENPDLKWETTTAYNIGLDMGLLNGKINATLELYQKTVSDLLNTKQLNSYLDINTVTANLGKTQSKGIEFTLNTKNITRKDFQWTTDYTFSMYRDRWMERVEGWKPDIFESPRDPIRPIYSKIYAGILPMGEAAPGTQPDIYPGTALIADIDGYKLDDQGNKVVENGRFVYLGKPDGKIDNADIKLIGTRDPGYIMGLSNSIKYKQFDFRFNFHALFDRIMRDPNFFIGDGAYPFGYNMLKYRYENTWTASDPGRTIPNGSKDGFGDFEYQQAWFIRLQNIALGYTLPQVQPIKRIFSSCRVYFNINNVFVLTPYKGLDPETDAHWGPYPNARTYTLGFDVRF